MGDTGSLAWAGRSGVVAVLIKRELLLVIVGGVFVVEVLSVVIQVVFCRIERQARLAHGAAPPPLRAGQLPETKVVIRFWIVSILLRLLSLSTLKLQ